MSEEPNESEGKDKRIEVASSSSPSTTEMTVTLSGASAEQESKPESEPAKIKIKHLSLAKAAKKIDEQLRGLTKRVEELEEAVNKPAAVYTLEGLGLKVTGACQATQCRGKEISITGIKFMHGGLYLQLACGHYTYYIHGSLPSTKTAYEKAK